MASGMSAALHLAVHLLGFTVAAGLAAFALSRRAQGQAGRAGLVVGGLLLALTHLATGGLMAGELVWPLYLRLAGYVALAVGAAGGLVAAPVVVAVGPLAVHLAAALAAVMAAVAAVRGTLGRGRDVIALAAGVVLWGGSDLLVREQVTAAAVLSIVGSVSVGWWLVRRTHASLLARYVGSSVVLLLGLAVGLASVSGVVFSRDLERSALERLDQVASNTADEFSEDVPTDLLGYAVSLAGERLAQELATTGDGGRLDDLARQVAGLPGVDVAALVDAEGDVVGSWGAVPEGSLAPSDEAAIGGDQKVLRALAGDRAKGLVQLGEDSLLAVGVAPVEAAGDAPLEGRAGALLVGRRIADQIVTQVRQRTLNEAAVLVGGQVAASTLRPELHPELAQLVDLPQPSRVVSLGEARRFLAASPITGDEGMRLGSVVLLQNAEQVADIETPFVRRMFFMALAGLVITVLLAAYAASRTAQPVRRLTEAAERIAEGDLSVRTDVEREDEVGRLAVAFDHMTEVLDRREEELREAAAVEAQLRSRLEIVTSSMGEALLATDEGGQVTTANPAAAELLGQPRENLVGQRVERVLVGTDGLGGSLAEALSETRDGAPVALRGSVRRDGAYVPVAATAAPLTGRDGARLGRVYVLRDITGEVEVERMKSEFLANISHELRTPLTPIRGYAEVMRAREVSHDQAVEFATTIAESAARLERVIGMLVDFAALEAGRMGVALEPTHLDEIVEGVVETRREREPERRLVTEVEEGLPRVQVDPELMERVLKEVVDNALKFSDGPVHIRAGVQGPQTVRVTVSDEGVGIPPDRLHAIQEDFHQADGSTTRRVGGLGLGLSIVRRILDRFHGDLRIESVVGKGTDVHLLLPVGDET